MRETIEYKNYEVVQTGDGSFTLFSSEYNQCYHSTKDGAFIESLHKHVLPAFLHQKEAKKLHILDICFGLGLNTLTTLWYNDLHDKKPLVICSPELDKEMLTHLDERIYPEALKMYLPVLSELLKSGSYKDERYNIELFIGDARSYIRTFNNFFDVVYQDAFSPDENPLLWTVEYFSDLKSSMKSTAILTTYSTALKTRIALDDNGFYLYLYYDEKIRASSLALLEDNISVLADQAKVVDVAHKKSINAEVKALRDSDIR